MNEYYDVIIVGTGAAGLYCALMLSERKKILMLTKQEADLSDSFLAQGGSCMLRGFDDPQLQRHYQGSGFQKGGFCQNSGWRT